MDAEQWTFQDVVEHLLDVFDSARAGRDLRMARRAAREALRELQTAHRWSYYEKRRILRTNAQQTTGTIEYTHSTRTVTLTGATWPTTARYYRIKIGDVHYPIDSYDTTTNIILPANQNPGADVAAGTSYILYRNAYPLPVDFTQMGRIWDIEDEREMRMVLSDQIHEKSIWYYETPDTPWIATIRNEGEYLNSLSLVLAPPPASARTYDYMYQRTPKPLNVEKFNTGEVSISSGNTIATVQNGTVSTDHTGSVIRFGDASNEPDSIFGGIGDTDNPFRDQRVILSVDTGSNQYTLDSSMANTYSTVKFVVSDPIDIEHWAMLTAYQRLAEAAFTRLTKRELKHRNEREQMATEALILAKERDSRNPVSLLGPAPYDKFSRANISTES